MSVCAFCLLQLLQNLKGEPPFHNWKSKTTHYSKYEIFWDVSSINICSFLYVEVNIWLQVFSNCNFYGAVRTRRGHRMALWLHRLQLIWSDQGWKLWRSLRFPHGNHERQSCESLWAETIRRKKYDCKRASCDLVSCDPYILSKGRVMAEWGLQHLSGPADEWRCKWREGEVKAFSDTKCTPEVQNAQPQHIKDTAPVWASLLLASHPVHLHSHPDKHLTPSAVLSQW